MRRRPSAALGPGFFAAAMVAGRLLGQWLELRVGDRRLLSVGALIGSGGLLLAAVAPAVPLALLGFALGGAGVSVAAPTLFGAAGRGASDAERGSAVASVTTISYLGFLVGPPLIGAVSGATDLRVGIGLLAGIALLLAVAAASARRALPDGGAQASLAGALPLRRLQHPARGRLRRPA